ncbi:MAG: mandelate racemase/muconate lactonizing enzyme family protein [Nitrososphaerales archaeon]|nr:mandelate racemase/muconate lactonizing enzyme family protein [Nitrososphaerales archaeon]
MRVETVEAFPIRIKADEKLKGGTFSYSYFQTVLVKVVCDGETGWGEAMTRLEPKATAALVEFLGRRIVGKKFVRPREAWNVIWRELRIRGHTRGTDVEALSGIEIALYDCYSRLKREPLCKMLSGRAADSVPAFAGSLFRSRGGIDEQVKRAREAGLKGAKVKIGFGPGRDLELLRKVRKAWPNAMLVADANGAYDIRTAEKACRLFREIGLSWFEEPLLSDDWAGYLRLGRQKDVRIGAGESWFVGDITAALEAGLVGVLEPSVSRCGGVDIELRAGRRAARRGVLFSPMTGMNSVVSLAASLHVAAAVPTIGVEFNPFPNPLQTELASGLSAPSEGFIAVPKGNGLGLEVDTRFIHRNAA